MSKMILLILLILNSLLSWSQDCQAFFSFQEGVTFEITNYDKKDKKVGRSIQKVIEKKVSDNSMSVDVELVNHDEKDKITTKTKYIVKCEGGKFYFDMNLFFDQKRLEAYKDMDIQVDAEYLEFPSNMKKGDELKDGIMTVTVSTSVMTIANIKVEISERLVDGIEKITTPAGTFTCTKISYNVFTKVGFVKVSTNVTEWYAKGVGIVKSESYNKKNGKYLGKSVLTKFN